MKKLFYLVCAFIALGVFFFSCTQEMVEQQVIADSNYDGIQTRSQRVNNGYQNLQVNAPPDFKVINGHLAFKNDKDYVAMFYYLIGKSEEELIKWSKTNGFTSLFNEYAIQDSIFMSTFVATRDYEPGESPIDKSGRITDPAFTSLFNADGVLLVGDTIYKLRGDFIYLIPFGDSQKIDEVSSARDASSLSYIPHFQHTFYPESTTRNHSRSHVIDVSSTLRVFVNFHSEYKRLNFNAALTHRGYMSGRKQNKVVVWMPDVSDPIVSGRINSVAEGGVWTGTGYNWFNAGWAYPPNQYNLVDIYGVLFGPVNVGVYRFTETFIFIKHSIQGAERSYQNIYTYLP